MTAGGVAGARGSKVGVVAVVVIFAVVIAAFAVSRFAAGADSVRYAVVHDGEGNETVIPLDGSEGTTFTVATSLGINVVELVDGGVAVSEADCPNGDCVAQGTIYTTGERIVCLPHELWVELVEDLDASAGSSASSGEFDTVTR